MDRHRDPDGEGVRGGLSRHPAAIRRRRGKQKAPTKQMVSIRLDPSVLDAYRATGKGWQSRMHQTLAEHAPRLQRRVTATQSMKVRK